MRYIGAFFRRLWSDIKKSFKWHILAIFGFLLCWGFPIGYVSYLAWSPSIDERWFAGWGIPLACVILIIYFTKFRGWAKSRLTEENVVARVKFEEANIFKKFALDFLNSVMSVGLIAILYYITVIMSRVNAFTVEFFRTILIVEGIGQVFYLLDKIVNIGKKQAEQEDNTTTP